MSNFDAVRPACAALVAGLLSACGAAPPPVSSATADPPSPASAAATAPVSVPVTLEPGCIGLTEDAAAGLFVVEAQTPAALVREARFVTLTGERASFPLGECPTGASAATCAQTFTAEAEAFRVSGERAAWLAGRALVPCDAAEPDAQGALAVPLGAGLRIDSTPNSVRVVLGDRTRDLWSADDRDPEDTSTYRATRAAWARGAGAARPNLFVELRRTPLESPDDVVLAAVPGAALGLAPCAPRPTSDRGPALPRVEPAPFDPADPGDDCLAATADGRHAAFMMMRSDSFDESEAGSERGVRWFGAEPPPTVDLSCLAGTCKPAQRKAMAQAGLVACRRVEHAVRIDGFAVPMVEGAGGLWLDLPGGPRWVRDIAMSAHDGGDHENFEAIFQTGATLPAFLYFTNADTGLSENRVTVLDDAAAGLCPR